MRTDLINTSLLEVPAEVYFDNDAAVVELKNKINEAVKESSEIVVMTLSSLESAAHYIKNYKAIDKKLESVRKDTKQPLTDKGKEIDNYFKKLVNLFSSELNRLENEIMTWKKKQDKIAGTLLKQREN